MYVCLHMCSQLHHFDLIAPLISHIVPLYPATEIWYGPGDLVSTRKDALIPGTYIDISHYWHVQYRISIGYSVSIRYHNRYYYNYISRWE